MKPSKSKSARHDKSGWTNALQGKLRKTKATETISASSEQILTRFRSQTRHIKRALMILLVLTSLEIVMSPTLGGAESLKWDGKYLQENGVQDLYLEQVDKLLSIDIVKAGRSKNDLAQGSHFVARIRGNLATFDDRQGCKTQLIRKDDGVEIKDYCGAVQRDNGRYEKVS